ncbi:hypothetical protein HK405_013839 [Cladochytrium tenue]|nr:hypothetical protein HK405_013839 [Cladochytrium tenue]
MDSPTVTAPGIAAAADADEHSFRAQTALPGALPPSSRRAVLAREYVVQLEQLLSVPAFKAFTAALARLRGKGCDVILS